MCLIDFLKGFGAGRNAAPKPKIANLAISANGTYNAAPTYDGYGQVVAAVPNTYAQSDEGKVVSNGALVSQTSRSVTENGTYDTTTDNSVVVNVQGIAPSFCLRVGDQIQTLYYNTEHSTAALDAYLAAADYDRTDPNTGMKYRNVVFWDYNGVDTPMCAIADLTELGINAQLILAAESTPVILYSTAAITYGGESIPAGWQTSSFTAQAQITVSAIDADFAAVADEYVATSPEAYGAWVAAAKIEASHSVTLGAAAPGTVTPTAGKSAMEAVSLALDPSVINAGNIAEGVTMLGIAGTHGGGGGGGVEAKSLGWMTYSSADNTLTQDSSKGLSAVPAIVFGNASSELITTAPTYKIVGVYFRRDNLSSGRMYTLQVLSGGAFISQYGWDSASITNDGKLQLKLSTIATYYNGQKILCYYVE